MRDEQSAKMKPAAAAAASHSAHIPSLISRVESCSTRGGGGGGGCAMRGRVAVESGQRAWQNPTDIMLHRGTKESGHQNLLGQHALPDNTCEGDRPRGSSERCRQPWQ